MKGSSDKKIHYAWFILVACCLLQSAITGVVQNGRGIFYAPVCSELGFETSAFTLYSLFHGIASFLIMPLVTKWFDRVPPRLSLTLSALLFCGSTALMGSLSELWQFYAAGALQGAGGALLIFYVCPVLINNWFDKYYGFAMGLYAAFSGLAGVIVNPLLNGVIEAAGWRNGYRVQGLMAFALTLPAVLLIRSARPEEVGLERLGESGSKKQTAAASSAETAPATSREKLILVFALIFTLFTSVINAYCQHFAKYALTIGLAPAVGAVLVSCSMAGNIFSKFGIGLMNDRIGAKRALLISTAAVALGFGGMLITVPAVLYPSAVLSGICMPLCSLCVPMFAKHLYGPVRYRRFYRVITMVMTLASSAGITILSLFYEIRYSYTPVFLLGIGMAGI